jgi:hypothetical protein
MSEVELPYEKNSFDFMLFFSIFTHLVTDEILYYFDVMKDYLKVGGRAITTWFLINKEEEKLIEEGVIGNFLRHKDGPLYGHGKRGTGSTQGFKKDFVLQELQKRNLLVIDIKEGKWFPRETAELPGQDMIVIENL